MREVTRLNESMMTNRRCATALVTAWQLRGACHAQYLLSAAVAYLRRYAKQSLE